MRKNSIDKDKIIVYCFDSNPEQIILFNNSGHQPIHCRVIKIDLPPSHIKDLRKHLPIKGTIDFVTENKIMVISDDYNTLDDIEQVAPPNQVLKEFKKAIYIKAVAHILKESYRKNMTQKEVFILNKLKVVVTEFQKKLFR